MKLVEDWREAPKWYSVWAAAVVTTIGGFGMYLTPEMLGAPILFAPEWTYGKLLTALTAFFGVTGLIGRLIAQPPKPPKEEQ